MKQEQVNSNSICYSREDIISILKTLNQFVVSCAKMGSLYHDDPKGLMQVHDEFIRDWDMFRKMSDARSILSDAFSDEVGDDDMDELERELQDVEYWSDKHRKPTKKKKKKR